MRLRVLAFIALLAGSVSTTAAAQDRAAGAGGPPLVLDATAAPGVDAERLRVEIAKETKRPVVLAGDPRGAPASAHITVVLQGAKLQVRYDAGTLEREVRAEDGAEARIQQITLLAGNLARNEADELVAQLRKPASNPALLMPEQAAAPSAAPATGSATTDEAYRRLESTLSYHLDADSNGRFYAGGAQLVVAAAAVPTGLYIRNRLDEELAGNLLIAGGLTFGLWGTLDLVGSFYDQSAFRTMHQDLVRKYQANPSPNVIAEIEQAWQRDAQIARSVRRWVAGTGMGVGALGLATGMAFALTAGTSAKDDGRGAASAAIMGASGIALALSVNEWFTPSPSERYYEGYMRATGQWKPTASIAPLPGGAAIALSGHF